MGAPPAGASGHRRASLSKGGAALKQMEAERTPLYQAAATAVLDNNSTLAQAVATAAALFEADERL